MKAPTFTLGLHAHSRGFGWVVFEGPFAPYDWGMVSARRDKNLVCMRRIERLLRRFQPEAIVLEAFERDASGRGDRVARLCRAIAALAADLGVQVAIYTRDHVRTCFSVIGAITRQEIAEAVARHVEAFRHRLPKPRRAWNGEDERMALFSAAALVLTHFRFGADGLFEALIS